MTGSLLWALAGAAAVAALWALAAWRAGAQVRAMATSARRLAAGEGRGRARPSRPGDLKDLGEAVDALAQGRDAALRELASGRDLLGGVLATMQEGVLVLDEKGRIEHVNPALREMLLLSGEARGRLPLEAIRNSELQEVLVRSRSQGAAASTELEVAGLKPRRLLVRASPLAGGPGGTLAVVTDVTELRRLETLRRDFVANVSHELRTPVASVRSAAETLAAGAVRDPEAATLFLAMIERNAERMQHLVDDLLDLTRIESRQLKLAPEEIDLADAAERALAVFRGRAEKKRIQLRAEVPPGALAVGDARALEQVLGNLVENAVKYCPDGSTIRVAATPSADGLRVAVADDGPGIEPRHLPRLFERFYRVDPGRSRDLGGTGLGLSIVKHLVEAMGGCVGVESVPGQGATFWFTLPAAPGKTVAPA